MAARISIKKVISAVFWTVAGTGVLVLLVAAIRYRNSNVCKGFHIEIAASSPAGVLFIDKKGIAGILTGAGAAKGQNKPIHAFDLRLLEATLGKNVWIKEAQLFFDNNGILEVKVIEREPVARVFTRDGNSCYIDSSGIQLPLAGKIPAQLPVFTGYPAEKIMLHGNDSTLTRDILHLSDFIRRDSFWMAQVSQVVIGSAKNFELEPTVGSQRIIFGDGKDIEAKFHRLAIFYREIMSRTDVNKYDHVDISYAGQIIATRRGSEHGRYDSVQGMNNIRQMIRSAQQLQPDTLRQRNVRPLEMNAATEQTLNNLDLLPEEGDTNRKKTTNNK